MSLSALNIFWNKSKQFTLLNWKYAALFALGSLLSFSASFAFVKHVTGMRTTEIIIRILSGMSASKYRNQIKYDRFSIQYTTRPSTACISMDAFYRNQTDKSRNDPTATKKDVLDPKSKYYYLSIRNKFNAQFKYHRIPSFMEIPKKIKINKNLNSYLYSYPGCSIKNGLILYIHGGGHYYGTFKNSEPMLCIIMQKLGCCALSLDYQLCPEIDGIPNQVNQCIDTYKYILNTLKVNSNQCIIMGESAGASLSLLTIQKIKELKLNQPCCGVLISIWSDLSNQTVIKTQKEKGIEDAMLGRMGVPSVGRAILIGSEDRKHFENEDEILKLPNYSSLNGVFKGICPLFVNASENEVLIGDSKKVWKKAKENGVDVECLWDECLPHATVCFAEWIPEARDSLIIIIEWMKKKLQTHN